MGKYKKGVLGYFRGKIGTVVGAVWNGIHYMRSLPDTTDNPTTAQLNVRAKMALVSLFLKHVKTLITVGYQQFNKGITPMNAATSYHLKNAVLGTSTLNYAIDYTKVVLSVGNLLPPSAAEVEIDAPAKVNFKWRNDAPLTGTGGTDLATVVVYNEARDRYVTMAGVAARSAMSYVLQVPPDFAGEEVHCWLSFVSVNGKEVSDSAYIGEFLVL